MPHANTLYVACSRDDGDLGMGIGESDAQSTTEMMWCGAAADNCSLVPVVLHFHLKLPNELETRAVQAE